MSSWCTLNVKQQLSNRSLEDNCTSSLLGRLGSSHRVAILGSFWKSAYVILDLTARHFPTPSIFQLLITVLHINIHYTFLSFQHHKSACLHLKITQVITFPYCELLIRPMRLYEMIIAAEMKIMARQFERLNIRAKWRTKVPTQLSRRCRD